MRIPAASLSLLLAIAFATSAHAELSSAALRDIAARIDYGWFTGDAGLIDAARDALDGAAGDPWSPYLSAYAAYRAAQLALARGQAADADLERCANEAEAAAADRAVAPEAGVLIVACAAMAAAAEPIRAASQHRRIRQGLAQAEAPTAVNPRLLLVRQGHLDDQSITVEAVVTAFRDARAGFPEWGEAEALLALSEQRLAAGDLRGARDALEETLLIAPDYTAALELKTRIGALTSGR
jgi:hypothetical protein